MPKMSHKINLGSRRIPSSNLRLPPQEQICLNVSAALLPILHRDSLLGASGRGRDSIEHGTKCSLACHSKKTFRPHRRVTSPVLQCLRAPIQWGVAGSGDEEPAPPPALAYTVSIHLPIFRASWQIPNSLWRRLACKPKSYRQLAAFCPFQPETYAVCPINIFFCPKTDNFGQYTNEQLTIDPPQAARLRIANLRSGI